MKKYLLSVLVLMVVVIFAGCSLNKKGNVAPADDNAEIILFFTKTCPHCKIVEQYIADNNIREKLSFSEREVSSDKAGGALMTKKQEECLADKKYVGSVPFLWTKEKCYLGQDEIIQFFKDKTNENK